MPGPLPENHELDPLQRPRGQRKLSPRMLRRRKFAAFQSQWCRDRGQVVEKVFSGEDLIASPALPEGPLTFWSELFSRPSQEEHCMPAPVQHVDSAVMGPVTEEELQAVLKAIPKRYRS